MKKYLKKAFSSLIKYPKIGPKRNLNDINNYNSTHYKQKPFFTLTTDDIDFSTIQNSIIDYKIYKIKKFGKKPWEKSMNNNIYSPQWTCNTKIIKNIKNNISVETNNILNFRNHKKFFKKNTETIFNAYSKFKNYKFKNELKEKYPLDPTINNIISNTKKLCFNNYVINLLKNERINIHSKEIGYKKALKKEENILNKDIKNFDNFKSQEKIKFKNLEKNLQNKINENLAIFEVMKQISHKHRLIMDEIKKILIDIIKFKNYGIFIHHILGVENDVLAQSDLGEKKFSVSNSLNYNEIEKIVKSIYSQSKKIFNKNYDEVIEELKFDPYKIYNIIEKKENMIMQLLSKKENINFERNLCLKDYKRELEIGQNKFSKYMSEYILYLEDYEREIEEIIYNEPNSKNYEYQKYMINLFYEIKKSLIKGNQKKIYNDIYLYSNLVIPCLVELQNKEKLINKLIKQMEFYENNDKHLFNTNINKIKLENKIIKFKEERESLRTKEIERKEKIVEKNNQVIITGKYKYNLPHKLNRVNSFSKELKSIKINNKYKNV